MRKITENLLLPHAVAKVLGLSLAISLSSLSASAEGTVLGIYGLVQVELPASGGMNLVGVHLGPDSGQPLEEVLMWSALEQAADPSLADQVHVWDFASQDYIAYFQKADGLFYSVDDPNGSAVAVTISKGEAIFLESADHVSNPKQIVLYGCVSDVESYTVEYSNSIVFANPYPVTVNLNDAAFDWSAASHGLLPNEADQVHVWDPNKPGGPGFQSYFLKLVEGVNLWHSSEAPFAQEDPILSVGAGAYYTAQAPFTNSIVRPFEN